MRKRVLTVSVFGADSDTKSSTEKGTRLCMDLQKNN